MNAKMLFASSKTIYKQTGAKQSVFALIYRQLRETQRVDCVIQECNIVFMQILVWSQPSQYTCEFTQMHDYRIRFSQGTVRPGKWVFPLFYLAKMFNAAKCLLQVKALLQLCILWTK